MMEKSDKTAKTGVKKSWKKQQYEEKEKKKLRKKEKLIKWAEREMQKMSEEKKIKTIPIAASEPVSDQNRVSTVSIAVPGSIMDNAQSNELRTYLAGQIARAACIFQIDEVIVFDDCGTKNESTNRMSTIETSEGTTTARSSCTKLARILQYLECPQYLRKFFFPLHNDLKLSGLLNPLDSQHHLRQQSEFIFREGVITNKPAKQNRGSFANVGLLNDVYVDTFLDPGLRVTVRMPSGIDLKSRKIRGSVVPPSLPRQETGIYWGYNVRIANCLSQVFTKCPYEGGYDLTVGTSDQGKCVHEVEKQSLKFSHALIVFGGVLGLEPALENDDKLNVDNVELLFDEYLNTVPRQGSRTVRTEEAILISMAALDDKLEPVNRPQTFTYTDSIPHSQDTGIQQYAFNEKREKKPNVHASAVATSTLTSNDNMDRFD